jgi:hypothetical protein
MNFTHNSTGVPDCSLPAYLNRRRRWRSSWLNLRPGRRPTTRNPSPGCAWDARTHGRTLPRFGVDLEPPIDRFHAVGEAAQAGAPPEVRATRAVVADLDREPTLELG